MANPKVPHVVQEASKAVERDIKPALKLMGKLFLNTWLGDQSFIQGAARAVDTAAPELPEKTSKRVKPQATVHVSKARSARPAPPPSPSPSTSPMIIDAVFVDEDCLTCGGAGKVGRVGHEVRCPACKGG
jgi:hypothetical protein